MDPDANMEEQLRLAKEIQAHEDDDSDGCRDDHEQAISVLAPRLAELVLALDEWLSKGGFLPKPWQHTRLDMSGASTGRWITPKDKHG